MVDPDMLKQYSDLFSASNIIIIFILTIVALIIISMIKNSLNKRMMKKWIKEAISEMEEEKLKAKYNNKDTTDNQ